MHAAAKFVLKQRATHLALAEDVTRDNAAWANAVPRLSVAIPSFRCDASFLLCALARCRSSAEIEIIVHDDGSRDPHLRDRLEAAAERVAVPVRLMFATVNRGRAAARNHALSHARSQWVLFLDADMSPDDEGFLDSYLDAMANMPSPGLVVGGISLKTASSDRRYALHRWQAQRSECLPASMRNVSPGRNVFTGNVLAHRNVLHAFPFDEQFAGWGWEDTDWGLRVETAFPIRHIDNPATHLGLDTDAALMSKYARSTANFSRLAARHPEAVAAMPLHRAAQFARRLPGRRSLTAVAERAALTSSMPVALRGSALKLWRALVHADAM